MSCSRWTFIVSGFLVLTGAPHSAGVHGLTGRGTQNSNKDPGMEPNYLKHWPGLYVRQDNRIVDAPAEDVAVARSYPDWSDKGQIINGKRITIMTNKLIYQENEEIRIIHVVEVVEPGHELFIMGPKQVYGEYIDEQLVSAPPLPNADPLRPLLYDGETVKSPGVDYNYDITAYRLSEPGKHQIIWKLDSLKSNTLTLEITTSVQ
jgi:hypothetical protein